MVLASQHGDCREPDLVSRHGIGVATWVAVWRSRPDFGVASRNATMG